MSEPLSVYERVLAVLADMPAIEKDQQAPGNMGGYRFRGIEQITAALKPLLAKHGVFMVPTVITRETEARTTKSGGSLYVVDLLIRFTFHGPAGDTFCAEVWGEGTDSGDKATQKAVTSAFKSMLGVTFCISDSETDAERHDVPDTGPAPEVVTREQVAALVNRLEVVVNASGYPTAWQAAKHPILADLRRAAEGEYVVPVDLFDAMSQLLDESPAVPTPLGTAAVAEGAASPEPAPSAPPQRAGSVAVAKLLARVAELRQLDKESNPFNAADRAGIPPLKAGISVADAGRWSELLDGLFDVAAKAPM